MLTSPLVPSEQVACAGLRMLSEESKKCVVINTSKSLFRYTCLPYGISSAPAIFQRAIRILASSHSTGDGIPGRHPDFCEDQGRALAGTRGSLAPTGESRAMSPREEVLILVPEVVYLGHKIGAEGLHPVADKVDAIQAAPTPKNVAKLKSYVQLLSYYRRFLPNLSTVLAHLYCLLRLSTKWKWARLNSRHSRLQRSCFFHPDYWCITSLSRS